MAYRSFLNSGVPLAHTLNEFKNSAKGFTSLGEKEENEENREKKM